MNGATIFPLRIVFIYAYCSFKIEFSIENILELSFWRSINPTWNCGQRSTSILINRKPFEAILSTQWLNNCVQILWVWTQMHITYIWYEYLFRIKFTSPVMLWSLIEFKSSGMNSALFAGFLCFHFTRQLKMSISGTPRLSHLRIWMKLFPLILIKSSVFRILAKCAHISDIAFFFNCPSSRWLLSASSRYFTQFSTAKWLSKNRTHLSTSSVILMQDAAGNIRSIFSAFSST